MLVSKHFRQHQYAPVRAPCQVAQLESCKQSCLESIPKAFSCKSAIADLHWLPLKMRGMTYRDTIREMMAERGWSQADLAAAAEVSPSALSRFFSQPDRDLDVPTLSRIARAFRVLPGDLLPHTTDAVPEEIAPLLAIVGKQPAALRRRLEEMAHLMIATWADARGLDVAPTVAPVGRTPNSGVTQNTNGAISDTVPSGVTAALLSIPNNEKAAGDTDGSRRNGIEENQPRGGRKPKR